jgi:multicomponent Na+:H+ antiporter subunit D
VSRLLALPVAVPLAASALAILGRRRLWAQRILGFGGSSVLLVVGVWLGWEAADGSVVAAQIGGFPPGIAIALVGDLFAALMLTVAGLMVLVTSAFAAARGEDRQPFFHPLVLVLSAGMAGAFLTADLFNLFVFFEVMLMASYALLTMGGTRERVRAGAVYVTTNLLASTLLVAGVALMYGTAGTVNIAELGAAPVGGGVAVAGGLLLVALSVKASLVPVHGWLPRAYPAASPAVAALFSGLLTKVGVYALYRLYSVVYQGDPSFRPLLLGIAAATMVLGVLGAVGREGMRAVLSFHIVSQVGYMIMGLGLFGPLGLAGGIFYVLHHIVVKTSLFLSAGAVETLEGTGTFDRLGGMARRHPVLAAGFLVSALSLAGLPPLSGFFAKLLLVREALDVGDYWVAGAAVGVSFLTLLSMVKIWNGVFWGSPTRPEPEAGSPQGPRAVARGARGPGSPPRRAALAGIVAPSAFLAAASVVVGVGAQALFELSQRAAEGLVNPEHYVQAVLGG